MVQNPLHGVERSPPFAPREEKDGVRNPLHGVESKLRKLFRAVKVKERWNPLHGVESNPNRV